MGTGLRIAAPTVPDGARLVLRRDAMRVWLVAAIRRLPLASVVACGALVGVCGAESTELAQPSDPPGWTTYHSAEWGYTVSFPRPWRRAERPVTPRLLDPREILALGTFPLRYRPTNCEAFAGSVRQDLGPADGFVTVQERGFDEGSEWRDFPPRPERLTPMRENLSTGDTACGDRPGTEARWLNFTDGGRHFHVMLVFGPTASAALREDAWRILNSLRVDPDVEPNWRASE